MNMSAIYTFMITCMGNLTCMGKKNKQTLNRWCKTSNKLVITPDEKMDSSTGIQFSALWDNLTHEAV